MFSKFFLKKSSKKDFLFLILQIHALILLLIVVLWAMARLNRGGPSFLSEIFSSSVTKRPSVQTLDQKRSATLLAPKKEAPSLEKK